MENKEKRVLVVDDGSEGVKAAIEALNAAEATRATEGLVTPIVIETREREDASSKVDNSYPILNGDRGYKPPLRLKEAGEAY